MSIENKNVSIVWDRIPNILNVDTELHQRSSTRRYWKLREIIKMMRSTSLTLVYTNAVLQKENPPLAVMEPGCAEEESINHFPWVSEPSGGLIPGCLGPGTPAIPSFIVLSLFLGLASFLENCISLPVTWSEQSFIIENKYYPRKVARVCVWCDVTDSAWISDTDTVRRMPRIHPRLW